jgi:hypothetical protein
MKAGQIAEGCASISESYRLDPAPGTLLNVADCAERLGKLATARQHYLDLIEQLPEADDRKGLARKKAKALEPRIPTLLLRLARGAPGGTLVMRDGVPLGSAALGVSLPVDPGKHVIEVQAPGHEAARVEVTLAEKEQRELSLEVGAPLPAPPSSSAAPLVPPPASSAPVAESPPAAPLAPVTPQGSGLRTAGWVLTGVGGVAVGASLGLGLLVIDRKATVEAHCRGKQCDSEGIKAGSSGRTLSGISTASFVVGALAAGAGVYLLLSSPRTEVSLGPGSLQGRLRF